MIKNAMIFAAGFGTRMQNHTEKIPKPLLKIGNKRLIDLVIDRLREYGIEKIVINCHYRAEQIISHLQNNNKVIVSHEEEILETGGGLINALPILGMDPIITVNSDTIWHESDLLEQLTDLWEKKSYPDLVMTFYDSVKMINHKGQFTLLNDNRVINDNGAKLVYAGIQIINPDIVRVISRKKFSLSSVYDFFIKNEPNKVYGMEYLGKIFHVGTPEELKLARFAINI
ncbi:MAG: nucleotidyltransferase family protein [Rickettsiaceae bacterium H1]|nr:nucleotidyltransferase family protein [Rickettsiaceae bacterium H1]